MSGLASPPNTQQFTLLYFFASWHASHSQLSAVFKSLPALVPNKNCTFRTVEAETNTEESEKYGVKVVPTFVFLRGAEIWGKVEEGDPAKISRSLVSMCSGVQPQEVGNPTKHSKNEGTTGGVKDDGVVEKEGEGMVKRLNSMVRSAPCFVFLKGTPSSPKCGFSRQVCELLSNNKVPFVSFDILEDESVRGGAKEVFEWPTFPMVFVKGELIGGLDVLKDMEEENPGELLASLELTDALPQGEEDVRARIDRIVGSGKVVVFMKGIPSEPKCGFSRQVCEILSEEIGEGGYETYNILEDKELRAEIKVYKEWPTFPQIYVGGELVGGLDVVRDMIEEGEFQDIVDES